MISFYKKNFNLADFRFNFIRPEGRAFKNFNLLVPKYSEIKRCLLKTVNLAQKLKVSLTFEAIPFCLLNEIRNFKEFVGEFKDGIRLARSGTEKDREEFFIEQRRRDELKIKKKSCEKCIYNFSCEGPWKNYTKIYGFQEFKPVNVC